MPTLRRVMYSWDYFTLAFGSIVGVGRRSAAAHPGQVTGRIALIYLSPTRSRSKLLDHAGGSQDGFSVAHVANSLSFTARASAGGDRQLRLPRGDRTRGAPKPVAGNFQIHVRDKRGHDDQGRAKTGHFSTYGFPGFSKRGRKAGFLGVFSALNSALGLAAKSKASADE